MRLLPCRAASLAAAALLALATRPALAVLDINDNGPVLDQGGFRLRVTNAGIIGNAFFDVGLSNDPSFEFPAWSGHECLNHAELWVGALDDFGRPHVSGGPPLEWRPEPDSSAHVRIVHAGTPGTKRFEDDDGDGQVDEEVLNGKDDDGDGEVDEDVRIIGDVMAAADYVDDRPEAVNYGYKTGEQHIPLGLSVHQEAYGWADAAHKGLAALRFDITNHSGATLRGVYCGVLADLDSRGRGDRAGHLNDVVVMQTYSQTFNDGIAAVDVGLNHLTKTCISTVIDTIPVVMDGQAGSGLPVVTVLGLGHTIDAAANFKPYEGTDIKPLAAYATAPGKVSFRYCVFSNLRSPGDGGVPTLDQDRYDALAGSVASAAIGQHDDAVVLLACGPFPNLPAGRSITLDVALIAASDLDSLKAAVQGALYLYHGYRLNLEPDSTGPRANEYTVGRSGLNGHEQCLEPPAGVSFDAEADCPEKFDHWGGLIELDVRGPVVHYEHGTCVWTDADCDLCTGFGGDETIEPWSDPGSMPPPPTIRATPGDHRVTIEWDNLPEILIKAGRVGTQHSSFVGYRLYKMGDWRNREALLPPLQNWALFRQYGFSQLNGETLLSAVTDSTLDYERILYEQPHFPVGRYRDVDTTALNGFDYLYAVTTVMDFAYIDRNGFRTTRRIESPIETSFDSRVVPSITAGSARRVWVVPNPFRGTAGWDRPAVPGDPLTRHIDFMGLPRARSTIRIYSVAGDFVAQIDHDGSGGNGEASWNLVSRNGQDVVSGIYMFTVESPLGHEIGHFVVIR